MANEENVKRYLVLLRDFDGQIVKKLEVTSDEMRFPYLMWDNRLFVSSRDEAAVMLERSYHLVTDAPRPSGNEH